MRIGDMPVLQAAYAGGGRSAAVRARLSLALELIDEVAPRVGARLRRDVAAIYLWPAGGSHFNAATRVITLDIGWSLAGTVEDMALTLVHEVTHARQRAMGVGVRRANRRRVEAHAVAESIDFAERLTPGLWTKPTLASLETEWWSREMNEQRALTYAEEVGIPKWPVRVASFIARVVSPR